METNSNKSSTVNWGILGAGNIARKFAASLALVPDARLVAVGSLSAERAKALGDEFGAPKRYASYEALAADPAVDVVYVATRNPFHSRNMRLCLEAGKPVLCEKPFSINAAEAAAAIQLAREKRLFLMEGMYTRFFPVMGKVREWLAQGLIGEPRLLQADFGIRGDWPPDDRHLNPALGGGALLDVGVYLVSLSSTIFGPPINIVSEAALGATGVDEHCGLIFRHDHGQVSVLWAAIRVDTRKEAYICGTTGRIEIHCPLWKPNCVTLTTNRGEEERVELPYESSGFQFEIMEVMKCLRRGELESELMPLDETLSIMRTLDSLRAQWRLRYPFEERDDRHS